MIYAYILVAWCLLAMAADIATTHYALFHTPDRKFQEINPIMQALINLLGKAWFLPKALLTLGFLYILCANYPNHPIHVAIVLVGFGGWTSWWSYRNARLLWRT